MDQAGGENFAILHLVLLELSLDHSAASLIVGHQFNLMHNIQLFERQLGLHLLGKLEERPRGSDTLFILSGVESGVVLTGGRGAIAACSVGSCAKLGTHRFGSVHARAGVGRLQVGAAVGCDHRLLRLLLSRLLLRWLQAHLCELLLDCGLMTGWSGSRRASVDESCRRRGEWLESRHFINRGEREGRRCLLILGLLLLLGLWLERCELLSSGRVEGRGEEL